MSDHTRAVGRVHADARLLILSDIHGNWDALSAVLQAEPETSDILCLGDWVNYGPEPAACVRWGAGNLRPGRALCGNHDLAAVTGKLPHHSSTGAIALEAIVRETRHLLSPSDLAFLANLPTSLTLFAGPETWLAVHALPSDPQEGYLRGDAPEAAWSSEVRHAGDPDVLLVGHTHRPFLRRIGRTLVVNPGSVGRPKDGDSTGSYAIWRDGVFCLRKGPPVVPLLDPEEPTSRHGFCSQPASADRPSSHQSWLSGGDVRPGGRR